MNITYDPATQFCPMRRNLEERNYNLVDRLSVLTDRLLQLIGHNHGQFLAIKTECAQVRMVMVYVQRELAEHRYEHGC